MPIVNREVQDNLNRVKHDYTALKDKELQLIVKAVSEQDAGNYDGKYVGTVALAELILRSSKKTQMYTLAIAVMSLIASVIAILK